MKKEIKKPLSLADFRAKFGNEDQCLKYLLYRKWNEFTPYQCRQCRYDVACFKSEPNIKRCGRCGYEESATAHTLYHKLKFPLVTAFEMVYRIAISKKGISAKRLAAEFGLSYTTCWYFRKKVQSVLRDNDSNDKLSGTIQVDELMIGGSEKEAPGRAFGNKRKVLIAVQVIEKQDRNGNSVVVMGNMSAQHIESFRKEQIKPVLEKAILKSEAILLTDEFKTYQSLKDKDQWNIRLQKSDKGNAHPQIHLVIMNFKNWLRGIHHFCKSKHLQDYINEFVFRFNWRNALDFIPIKWLNKTIHAKPIYQHEIMKNCKLAI